MINEEYEEYEEDYEYIGPSEPETPAEKIVASTPWWAISTGLHVLVALIAGALSVT